MKTVQPVLYLQQSITLQFLTVPSFSIVLGFIPSTTEPGHARKPDPKCLLLTEMHLHAALSKTALARL